MSAATLTAPSAHTSHAATADSASEPDPETLFALADTCLDDDKAEDTTKLDLRGRASITDYMIIASGRSNRHVAAMADHLHQKLKHAGARFLHVEGLPQADWVIIDAGDVVVHLFRPEVRAFYDIEKMWKAIADGTA